MQDGLDQHAMTSMPVFPLPTVVLFPRAVLPLHIFEQRYRQMASDVLSGDRLLAMALLKPGWEQHYHFRPPIDSVVCVGRVIQHELLADGRYNFLLEGVQRAEIVSEDKRKPYRLAKLKPLIETSELEIDLIAYRQRLLAIVNANLCSTSSAAKQFHQLLSGPLKTSAVVDLMAFALMEDVNLKQSLLAETNVVRRVERVVSFVEHMLPVIVAKKSHSCRPSSNN